MTQPRLVGGRYELGELIGYGGMAEVHKGRDVRLGRDVAIKVLRADLARDPAFLNRFRREAQSAAGLNHPSIVSVYDTGEDVGTEGTSQPYIVMEFVAGRTLREILKAEGRLPVRRAMEITADVSAALDFSHRAGLVHRDVKPANVMITPTGAVKVMDFGIARAVADTSSTATQTANVIGTAQYLSPEQARGESVDARSDVYSTGCLLYELVTGVPPFQGDSPVAVAYQHVRENASAPSSRVPDLPPALDSIVMKALAKNPQNRYQSAAEMRTDLQRALADQPVAAELVMTDAERTQFIKRTPAVPIPLQQHHDDYAEPEHERRTALIWVAIVVALLLVVGAGAFFIYKLGDSSSSTKNVTLPNLVGQTAVTANQALGNPANCENAGTCVIYLMPDVNSPNTPGPCDDGTTPKENLICKIVDQSNKAVDVGTAVPQGTHLFYETYKKAEVSVPYVQGLTQTQAVAALKAAQLQAVISSTNVNTFNPSKGLVAKQSVPANTAVSPNTKITLQLSSGQVLLAKVIGKKLSDARAVLNGQQFTNLDTSQTRTTHDPKKDGLVYDQDPTPGIAYPQTQKITLIVYKYKAVAPTCDPSKSSLPSGSDSAPPDSDSPSSPPASDSSVPSGGASSSTNTLPPC